MTIYILYSADYELFLGGNYYDETEVLIDPTNNILDLFDRLNIPITLFADVFSILRYKEKNLHTFPENAENQLRDAIRRGHDVQAHVHPHWPFAEIEGNHYNVNPEFFLLGNLDENKAELYVKIRNFLSTSRIYLNSLLSPIDKNYSCIAFRAGGYGLQPNSDVIIKALIESGFLIDSSIVPIYKSESNVNMIDFSNVPSGANYYLDNDIAVPSKSKNGIFEIPIASCTFDLVSNLEYQADILLNFLSKRKIQKIQRGYTIQYRGINSKYQKYSNYVHYFFNRIFYLDCSTDDEKMFRCTKKYLGQFDFSNHDIFFSFNMHPKSMTDSHIIALKKYHEKIKNYYGDDIKPISFQQASKMVINFS
jgi:hypothetical protein